MDFLPQDLQKYIEDHSQKEPELLHRLYRETHLKVPLPQMLAGHLQGQVIRMLSLIHKPKVIVEIGTFTGYSGICLADGLAEGGKLYSFEIEQEREEMIRRYWTEAGILDKTELIIGDATKLLPEMDLQVDLAFIDADKVNYPVYLDLLIPKLRIGGLILGDNTLWSGKVVDSTKTDKDTEGIRQFNDRVQKDERLENVLIPVRDGLMLARKVKD